MTQRIDYTILQRYQIVKKIGQGAYGHVWKAKDRKTSNLVALKKIYDAYRNQTDAQRTYRQIMYSRQFSHRNITKLLGFHTSDQSRDIYTAMEFVDYDLQHVIAQSLFKTNSQRYFVIFQIINAVEFLHNADLVHRDLKPANVLLTKEWVVKLCDFGLIRSVHKKSDEEQIVMTQNIATRWYRAPQILLGSNDYGKPVDIWSMGCIFAQIISGKVLFSGQNALNQLEKILQITGKPKKEEVSKITHSQTSLTILENLKVEQKNSLAKILNNADADLVDLISRMVLFNPKDRITIEEIKMHPFLLKFIKKDGPKSSHFKKQPKPITIQFDSERLAVKKYKSLLNAFAEPVFQDNGQSRTKYRNSNVPSYLQKKVNPETSKYASTTNIKLQTGLSTSAASLTSKNYQQVSQGIGKKFKKSFGIQQIVKLNRTEIPMDKEATSSDRLMWLSGIKRNRDGNNQNRQTFDRSVSSEQHQQIQTSTLKKDFGSSNKYSSKSPAFKNCQLKNVSNQIGSATKNESSFELKDGYINQSNNYANAGKLFLTKSVMEVTRKNQPKLISQANKKLGTKIKGQIMTNNSQKQINLYMPSHLTAVNKQKKLFNTSKQKIEFLKKMNINNLSWNI